MTRKVIPADSIIPSPARALALSRQGGDMYEVERMAESQAGIGGFDQYGSNEYEDGDLDFVGDKQQEWE